MNDKTLRDLYGLKYNPFEPSVPTEALWEPPRAGDFFDRMERMVRIGGFGLITGVPGTGKSKVMQLLADRLTQQGNVEIGVMERPQSGIMDFYRELGALFGVNLSPANRYGGFRALRNRWSEHIKATMMRPVLLIDEAQETHTDCLSELRILGSLRFDSLCLLTTVLCGDNRLEERLKGVDLMPLHSRIHARLNMDDLGRDELRGYLIHALEKAGAPHLMNENLMTALADHANGNLRRLNNVAAQLVWMAAKRELATIDENLFLDLCTPAGARSRSRKQAGRTA